MPFATLELNAGQGTVDQPIIWRLSRLFNVVTNIRRARITEDYAYVELDIEGSSPEIAQAEQYLRDLGVLKGGDSSTLAEEPENSVSHSNTIVVQINTVTAEQAAMPLLYRVGKDLDVVVNILDAHVDAEDGGQMVISIAGDLIEVQRAIAYLHTTGLSVKPRQRSVTDFGNL